MPYLPTGGRTRDHGSIVTPALARWVPLRPRAGGPSWGPEEVMAGPQHGEQHEDGVDVLSAIWRRWEIQMGVGGAASVHGGVPPALAVPLMASHVGGRPQSNR